MTSETTIVEARWEVCVLLPPLSGPSALLPSPCGRYRPAVGVSDGTLKREKGRPGSGDERERRGRVRGDGVGETHSHKEGISGGRITNIVVISLKGICADE